jgi:hypothetical protein
MVDTSEAHTYMDMIVIHGDAGIEPPSPADLHGRDRRARPAIGISTPD